MAQDKDPRAALSQAQEYVRISRWCGKTAESAGRWCQEYYSLKTPDEALKCERERLLKLLSEVRAAINSYVRPDQQDLLHQGLEDIIRFAGQLGALEPGCECKAEERRQTYANQLDECVRSFPARDVRIPEDAELSPTPSAETRLGQGGSSPSSSDGASEKSTSPSVSPPGGATIAGPHRDRVGQEAWTAAASSATDSDGSVGGTRVAVSGWAVALDTIPYSPLADCYSAGHEA